MDYSRKHNKYPEHDPKDTETSELLDKDIKTMVLNIPKELQENIDKE